MGGARWCHGVIICVSRGERFLHAVSRHSNIIHGSGFTDGAYDKVRCVLCCTQSSVFIFLSRAPVQPVATTLYTYTSPTLYAPPATPLRVRLNLRPTITNLRLPTAFHPPRCCYRPTVSPPSIVHFPCMFSVSNGWLRLCQSLHPPTRYN